MSRFKKGVYAGCPRPWQAAVILTALTLGLVLPRASLAAANTWSPTGALATARVGHTATLLPNGRVLVAGGATEGWRLLNTAELYNAAGQD